MVEDMAEDITTKLSNLTETYASVLKAIAKVSNRLSRNIESRLDNLAYLRRELEPGRVRYLGNDFITAFNKMNRPDSVILGIDGSSRVIDTAYMFLGIASLSIYSRHLGEVLDHPPLPIRYTLPPLKEPFIAISIDLEEPLENIELDKASFTLESPVGVRYSGDYNKTIILDEIRTNLENKALIHLAKHSNKILEIAGGEFLVFIDGPIYPTPNIFKQYYHLLEVKKPSRGRLDDYIASWRKLLEDRIKGIKMLEELNAPVVGIVKRIESSRILVVSDEYRGLLSSKGIVIGDLGNDQAFIDLVLRLAITKGYIGFPLKPLIIGPIHIPASASYVDKFVDNPPDKIAYYIVSPLSRYSSLMLRYTLYRIEMTLETYTMFIEEGIEPYRPSIYDSIGVGTALPFTILYTDKRCKQLSRSIARVIAADLESRGIPLTYDTIRMIEAYVHE